MKREPPAEAPGQAPAETLAEKNHEQFDDVGERHWELCVYAPVHDGWRFTSIAGRETLDCFAQTAQLTTQSSVLDACCGLGDAARYLAERTGCAVLGIDVNAQQIAHAKARLLADSPALRHRVRYLRAPLETFDGDSHFDAAIVLDSLMYLPDRRRSLAAIAGALKPGGHLLLAEVLAGARCTGTLRRELWRAEGIATLPTPAEQCEMLRACGFVDISLQDARVDAVGCFRTIVDASTAQAGELAALGPARHAAWLAANRFFLDRFEENALTYAVVTARRPPGVAGSGRRPQRDPH